MKIICGLRLGEEVRTWVTDLRDGLTDYEIDRIVEQWAIDQLEIYWNK